MCVAAAPDDGAKRTSRVMCELVESPEAARARQALSGRITLRLATVRPTDALRQLAEKAEVPIDLEGVDAGKHVHVDVENATFDEAFRALLALVDMEYTLKGGTIRAARRPSRQQAREAAHRRVEATLKRRVTVEFPGTGFENVINFLRDLTGLNFVIDIHALADQGMGPDFTIMLKLTDVSLADALDLILDQVELDYVIRGGVVFVTDPERARKERLTEAFRRPVSISAKDKPIADVLLTLEEQTGLMPRIEPAVLRALQDGARTPVSIEVTARPGKVVYEYLAYLLRARLVLEQGTATYQAVASQVESVKRDDACSKPATCHPNADD